MTLEPIPGSDGAIVDYFETDQQQSEQPKQGTDTSHSTPDQQPEEGQEVAVEETVVVPEAVEVQQSSSNPAPTTTPTLLQKEDTTDFDLCDIEIKILLQRADGHPQGRLVSVLIHNFSGSPVVRDFREADLTDKARLDAIQRAIYPTMQAFLLELSKRKQKKLEEEAKRAKLTARIVPPAKQKTDTPATTAFVGPEMTETGEQETSEQSVPATPAIQQEETTNLPATQKTDATQPAAKDKSTRYQPIPLF